MTNGDGAVSLSSVIGRNARRLRGTATADDVAKAARQYGLNWGTGRISDLEHGRVSPTLPTLVALAFALTDVCNEDVELSDLIASDEKIALTKVLKVSSDELSRFLTGEQMFEFVMPNATEELAALRKDWPARLQTVKTGAMLRVSRDYGEPEERLGRDLGLDRVQLMAEMAALWGRSFRAERDHRAGDSANAQKKGRVARELKSELRTVLDGDD